MTLKINMLPDESASGGLGIGVMTSAGNPWSVPDALANELVNRRVATYAVAPFNDDGSLGAEEVFKVRGVVSGGGKYATPDAGYRNSGAKTGKMIFRDPANIQFSTTPGEVFTQDPSIAFRDNPVLTLGLTTSAYFYKFFSANGESGTTTPVDVSDGATVSLYWYMPQATKALVPTNNGAFTVYLGSDATLSVLTNRIWKAFGFNGMGVGWNVMSDHTSLLTPAGSPVLTSIKQAGIRIDNNNALSGATAVPVAFLAVGYKARPKVVLMMDDGYEEQHSKAGLPLTSTGRNGGFFTYLQSKGLRGTVGIIANFVDAGTIGANTTLTTAQCDEIYQAGFDLATHGNTYLLDLTTVAAMRNAIRPNRDFLVRRGWTRGANLYIVPGGGTNDNVFQAVRELGFVSARTVIPPNVTQGVTQPTAPFVHDMLNINGVTMGSQTAVTMKSWIDRAELLGQTLFLYGHAFEAGSGVSAGGSLYTRYNEFTDTVDYAAARQAAGALDVVTYSEWVSGVSGYGV